MTNTTPKTLLSSQTISNSAVVTDRLDQYANGLISLDELFLTLSVECLCDATLFNDVITDSKLTDEDCDTMIDMLEKLNANRVAGV